MDDKSVAVIGGGWAGCAAAVALARAGVRVTLYEAAAVLGGRARRVERAGLPLDNGQHLLLGAYAATLDLLHVVHGGDLARVVARRPLTMVPLSRTQPGALTLVRGAWPGKAGLVVALLTARGLTPGERFANLAWFDAPARAGASCVPRARRLDSCSPRFRRARLRACGSRFALRH